MSAMPQDSMTRTLLHTREIVCKGYQRSDGVFDIEGRLQDLTNEATDLPFHHVPHGGTIHDMRLVMTLDADMVIQNIEATTATGATPFCAEASVVYSRLRGLKIAAGFKKNMKAIVGGSIGCTHLTELLERMASTAMQTMFSAYRTAASQGRASGTEQVVAVRSWVIGTCHAYREDGDAAKLLWPQGLPEA
ncbi:molybdopterin-guanine dinucleotide biosynthesis protein MobB [Pseudomonas sp. GW456-E7]|nr:molybdopterin-guanine dinucleotide biosynthesis protein MobB [Pseudomonas sp. GW456-E7]